jgi:hypothetical protein
LRDTGLDYGPRQLFSSISYKLSTILRRVYDKLTNPATITKNVKITKMASNDNPHPTVLSSEGSIHTNLHKEVITGFEEGMKVFKGTYYRQVKLVQATELDLAVALEQVKTLESKTELVNLKLEVPVADSEHWKRMYNGMLDRSYGAVDSSQNSSRKSVKIAATPAKGSTAATQSTSPKQDSGKRFSPLR